MRRALLAMLCGAALAAASAAHADTVSDREMADRYSQAAQAGDSDAEFYLGALYSAGVGRRRSDEEAFQWFSRAADQGHSHAMLVLSGLYAIGRGTAKDNASAYKWAYIVSVGSHVEEFRNGARQLMSVLETKMTRDDVDRAKAEAARWHAVSNQVKPAAVAPTGPAADTGRDSAPQSAAPAAKPAPTTTVTDSGKAPPAANDKKNDVDALIDKLPSDLRKRLGF